MYPCSFFKNIYLHSSIQFFFFIFFFFTWWCLKTFASKKKSIRPKNSAYYCHERAYQQIYQFHLEGVVLTNAFVSKSELFEDKHSIIQSVAPLFLPFHPLLQSRKAQMKVWKEMENKLFICIWEETRHLNKFSLHSLCAAVKLCYGEPERGEAQAIAVNVSEAIRCVNELANDHDDSGYIFRDITKICTKIKI